MLRNRLNLGLYVFILLVILSCTSKYPPPSDIGSHSIVCVGDSITYGFKLADPQNNSYPSKLATRSKGKWRVTNLGVNGATALSKGDIPYTAQDQYRKLMDTSPDIVVVMLGTNDLKDSNWTYRDEFVSDYSNLISEIKKLPSAPQVIVCTIPSVLVNAPTGISAERQAQVNAMIKAAADLGGAKFLDIGSLFAEQGNLFIDGIHPSNRGTSLIADTVYSYITTI